MNITTSAGTHECAKAERHKNGVHLFDENGELIVVLESPEDIRSVEDGEIIIVDYPNPTQIERIEAQVAYTAMMTDTLLS